MAALLIGACPPALAADVALVGTIADKAAVIAIDGGEPKTVKLGQTWSGVRVISIDKDGATVMIDGKRRVLVRGQHYRSGAAPASGRQSVTLAAGSGGHFTAEGAINGIPLRFLVDTGATMVALPASDALRLGIEYRKGLRGTVQTANGTVAAYRVMLDRVKIGAIELINVEGMVIEQGLSAPLLGMSFLNRVEMRREGDAMVLERRF